MSLRIRRGTDAQRVGVTLDLGEVAYTTDTKKLYIGDGATAGGINAIATSAGTGLIYNPITNALDLNTASLGISTSDIPEGTNKYFTTQRAQDATAALFASGTYAFSRISVADGTAATPSIGFTTDGSNDTGFFHPADGVLCVTANGQERVRFDPGGIRTSGFMKVGNFNGSGARPSPAEIGMIIFDTSDSHFYGYNGTTWTQLDN